MLQNKFLMLLTMGVSSLCLLFAAGCFESAQEAYETTGECLDGGECKSVSGESCTEHADCMSQLKCVMDICEACTPEDHDVVNCSNK